MNREQEETQRVPQEVLDWANEFASSDFEQGGVMTVIPDNRDLGALAIYIVIGTRLASGEDLPTEFQGTCINYHELPPVMPFKPKIEWQTATEEELREVLDEFMSTRFTFYRYVLTGAEVCTAEDGSHYIELSIPNEEDSRREAAEQIAASYMPGTPIKVTVSE